MARSSRSVAVIGLGSFGGSVARQLSRFGDNVLGIDHSESRVSRFSDELYRAVIADARDERAMEEAGLGNYDVVVVAIGSELECSVLSVMNARQAGVKEIWAKASSVTHARILESIGVDRILQPEHEFGEHIAHVLHSSSIQEYVRLGPHLHLASIRLGAGQAGRTVEQLELPERFELRCLGLVRAGNYMECGADAPLVEEDVVLVAGTRENMRAFAEKL